MEPSPTVLPASRVAHTRRRPLQRLAALALALFAAAAHAGPLSLEERVACQTALDEVRWSQSLWPEVNPGPKPTRAEVLPDDAIRAKVLDHLRREQALLGLYGERIDTPALQAELDRMARATRAPAQLRQLHAALGHDATTVAECLARPTLVERRLRLRYAADATQHAAVRARAEQALATGTAHAATTPDTQTHTVTYLRVDNPAEHAHAALAAGAPAARDDIALDPDAWDRLVADLDRAAARDAKAAAPQPEESDTAFYHRRIVARSADRLVLQVRAWDKRSVDHWWRSEAVHWQPLAPAPDKAGNAHALTLPPIHGIADPQAKDYGPGDVMPDNTWRTESGAPRGRFAHTAVWTGAEMIVWGGRSNSNGPLSSGGRFDLLTGTWTPLSTSNAPAAREYHTAIWTGEVMLVWGGRDAGAYLDTGASYDPDTDTWTPLPAVGNVVSARFAHTAVWTGAEMIVWGGYTSQSVTNTGARYDPDTEKWTAIPTDNAPTARRRHTAVWADDHMIVWGGEDGTGASDNGGIFNPAGQGSWQPTPANGPAARFNHTAVWAPSLQTMIVWGGDNEYGDEMNSGSRLQRAGNSWTWSATSTAKGVPTPRDEHTAVWTGSRMLVFGGLGDDTSQGASYNSDTDTWTALPLADQPGNQIGEIYYHTAVWSETDQRMLVWGGIRDVGDFDARTLIYDPAGQGTWTIVGDIDLPHPRLAHSAVWTGTQMLLWGGVDEHGIVRNDGDRYVPATGDWLPMPTGADRRYAHTAVWTGIDMFVWGGYNAQDNAMGRGARYNPLLGDAGEWVEPSVTLGPPRARHRAVWTGERMLVWGGYSTSINSWISTGLDVTPGNGNAASTGAIFQAPDARSRGYYAMAWAEEPGELMLWGGWSNDQTQTYSDGWRYNPQTQASAPIPSSGDARVFHEIVWTGNSLLVVGGVDGTNTPAAETWAYFPADNDWTSAGALAQPRIVHTLVWTGSQALAWGGLDEAGFPQTGERITPPPVPGQAGTVAPMTTLGAPVARAFHTAVWAPDSAELFVWGGLLGNGALTNDLGVYSASGIKPPAIFADGFE